MGYLIVFSEWMSVILHFLLKIISPFFPIFISYLNCFLFISVYLQIFERFQIRKIALFIIVTILFCYVEITFGLACLVKPGSIDEVKEIPNLKDLEKFKINKIIANESNFKLRKILFDKEKYDIPTCKSCKKIKLLRAHHCSICNKCVFKMEHHCSMINNCVGQNNHKYFLQFLFFSQIYVLVIMIFTFYNWDTKAINLRIWRSTILLCIISSIILSFFGIWQWLFAIRGITTIEFWALKYNYKENERIISDFSFGNWRDNLFLVFGTDSILKSLFVISLRKLPYNGMIWTRIIKRYDNNLKSLLESNKID